MYFAVKNGMRCRIPERKKEAYELMDYTCTKIGSAETKKATKPVKEVKQTAKSD
nr:MAG: hypothetical protein [Bacteriophage sp.]